MIRMSKKMMAVGLSAVLVMTMFAGCGGGTDDDSTQGGGQEITVVSREDGSGTRGAFIELFGIQEESNGEKVDMTTQEASITNNTSVMMTTVAGDENAIGYISMGSMNDSVKALKIDGVEANVTNVESGTYKIARPFNIATKGETSEIAQDFVNFILSAEGQAVVEENGYIPAAGKDSFAGTSPTGKIVIAGSSSVSPVMEKLKEAYVKLNPNAIIEIQQSDSSTGMSAALEGICDIGMASRELKSTELEGGLTATVIAMDGIAVIVNNNNAMDELSSDQVKSIFTGETTLWDDLSK